MSSDRRCYARNNLQSLIGASFSPVGKTESYFGLINDISREGLGIASAVPFPPGTLLDIFPCEDKKNHFVGEVRWCIPDEWDIEVYHLGIKALASRPDGGEPRWTFGEPPYRWK